MFEGLTQGRVEILKYPYYFLPYPILIFIRPWWLKNMIIKKNGQTKSFIYWLYFHELVIDYQQKQIKMQISTDLNNTQKT